MARLAVRLEARTGHAQLLDAGEPRTSIWGYNGTVPGPTIRIARGGEIEATLVNGLDEATTIHWHGVHIDNAMDGVAHLTTPLTEPGATFDYRFHVPHAGTYWYHPHAHRAMQQGRGLYGLLVVEEREHVAVDRDLALVIDDWRLENDGSIETRSLAGLHDAAHAGRLGNVITINGQPLAQFPVRRHERLRMRLCNTCNARSLELRLEDVAVQLVAIDGMPVPPMALADGRIDLPPGGRADIVVDVTGAAGTLAAVTEVSHQRLVLGHLAVAAGAPTREQRLDTPLLLPSNGVPLPDLRDDPLVFDLRMEGGAMGGMPEIEVHGKRMDLREAARRHRMVWAFNGKADAHDAPVFKVKSGRPVAIRIDNATAWPHAMHLHGHHFVAIQRSTGALRPWLHDTLLMGRRETATLAFVAGKPGRWMLHCHMLEHQMSGMSCYFEVEA
ncbi:MAG: multicopper oxidase family protein [Hyphomicrobiaceae bacterium]